MLWAVKSSRFNALSSLTDVAVRTVSPTSNGIRGKLERMQKNTVASIMSSIKYYWITAWDSIASFLNGKRPTINSIERFIIFFQILLSHAFVMHSTESALVVCIYLLFGCNQTKTLLPPAEGNGRFGYFMKSTFNMGEKKKENFHWILRSITVSFDQFYCIYTI